MSIFSRLFRKSNSASVAKDRLMVAIATDRKTTIPEIENMKRDIIAVVERYMNVENIDIKKENKGEIELLEIDVAIKNR
jgi:cell division topological specificity factor